MNTNFNDSWLEWAVQIEEEAGCDVQAGLPLGKHFKEYIEYTQRYINHEKLMSVLQEELGEILSSEDIEQIAIDTQKRANEVIKEKAKPFHAA
ncbi:MAG: hypothetical protein ACFCU5_02505 [Pleurocapsa sp.]